MGVTMSNEAISALFGFFGVILGSFIPIIYQTIQDKKNEKKYLREKSIEKMNEITKNLNNVNRVIQVIIDFLDDDFDDHEYDIDRDINFKNFCKIYYKDFPYFWDDIVSDLYLLLPDSTKTAYFSILNSVMIETRNMTENINEYFEDEQVTYKKIQKLQKSFEYNRDKYFTSLYAKILLLEELQHNISGNYNDNLSVIFYKKHEIDITNAIEHCT
jgi:hypothetical protein